METIVTIHVNNANTMNHHLDFIVNEIKESVKQEKILKEIYGNRELNNNNLPSIRHSELLKLSEHQIEVLLKRISINYEFAKDLKLLDILSFNCFCSDSVAGNQLIDFFNHAFKFILVERYFNNNGKYRLILTFEINYDDDCLNVHRSLISQNHEW